VATSNINNELKEYARHYFILFTCEISWCLQIKENMYQDSLSYSRLMHSFRQIYLRKIGTIFILLSYQWFYATDYGLRWKLRGVNFISISCMPFHKKVLWAAFLLLQFGFVIFWQKNIGTKAARKMLNFRAGINFINVLFALFSYESLWAAF